MVPTAMQISTANLWLQISSMDMLDKMLQGAMMMMTKLFLATARQTIWTNGTANGRDTTVTLLRGGF